MASDILEWMVDNIVPWFLILIILFVVMFLIAFPIYEWREAHSPTFELKKSDWVCGSSHAENTTAYVLVGKIMTPITSSTSVCDQWIRKSSEASEVKP